MRKKTTTSRKRSSRLKFPSFSRRKPTGVFRRERSLRGSEIASFRAPCLPHNDPHRRRSRWQRPAVQSLLKVWLFAWCSNRRALRGRVCDPLIPRISCSFVFLLACHPSILPSIAHPPTWPTSPPSSPRPRATTSRRGRPRRLSCGWRRRVTWLVSLRGSRPSWGTIRSLPRRGSWLG